MKIPLRYQNTEYDCGTTSFINALAYLYDREDIPVELIKAVYKYTLDVESDDVIGKGGTSRKHAKLLAKYFTEFANKNTDFNIKCTILSKNQVNLPDMKNTTDNGGVIIARCMQEVEHYIIITKIDNHYAYIFDPYYLDYDYYDNDEDVEIVLHKTFTHNRKVKIERLFSESNKDFSLLKESDREIILMRR